MSRRSVIGSRMIRTGKRPVSRGNGGDFVGKLTWKMGDTKRLVFPVLKDENGDSYIPRFAQPYHDVNKLSEIQMTSRKGTKYNVYKVRCMFPYNQTNPEDALKIAEHEQECVFCNLAKYENRRMLEAMNERFGEGGFSELSKAEQKDFYNEFHDLEVVGASSYKRTDEETGDKYTIPRLDIYTLALELEMEKEETETRTGKKTYKYVPVIDEKTGIAKYKPVLVPMSAPKELELVSKIDSAIEQDVLKEEDLHIFSEGEGENEEEIFYGFIDVGFEYPEVATKSLSGRKMNIVVQNPSIGTRVVTPEFIEEVQSKSSELYEKAQKGFEATNKNLAFMTEEEQLNLFSDGGELYRELKEKYEITEDNVMEGYKTDKEFMEDVFSRILNQNNVTKSEDIEQEVEEIEDITEEEVVEEKEVKKPVKKPTKKAVVEEVEESSETEDMEESLDEIDDLDDLDDL